MSQTDEGGWRSKPSFMKWTACDVVHVTRHHWIPCLFVAGNFWLVCVESTTQMIPASSPPFDLGFVATRSLHRVLASSPTLNTVLAALNSEYLGSELDFPVGNSSFFYFFSGHVACTTIASLDMRRMQRFRLAMVFDILNVLQSIRLLGTRGHYTIDLAVGFGAAIFFDSLAGKYEASSRNTIVGTGSA
ncbi:hypothetical protein Bca52824_004346 [Brassica carinata]|uniref:AtPDCT1/2 transmembrane domain-containing protein n=1 Tax=Brassica carinata TaxID=52824 RepID=A0A8X7WMV9_BRACI|nr:hypothetical protein Bca52824_004346 [Brassica carinata]